MEMLSIIGGIFIFGVMIFVLIEYPYIIATFILFSYIYNFNIETSLPLDLRGIILILLFSRLIIFDRENIGLIVNNLFTEKYFHLITIFLLLSLFVALFYSLKFMPQIRSFILLSISIFLGFIVTANEKGKNVFFYAVIIAGLISAIDIFYTFLFTNLSSSLNITRVIDKYILFKESKFLNQADFGIRCAMGFIYIFLFYVRKEINKLLSLILMFMLGMGILISTSRSTIISIFIIFILATIIQKEINFSVKTILNIFFIGIIFFVSFYFFYNTILKSSHLEKSTMDQIYWRLYEEPLKIFGADVNVYNDYNNEEKEGTMTWRYLRSMNDLQRFSKQSTDKKIFGIGIGGYERTNFAHDPDYALNAHNGYVLLLIERGILGLVLFLIFSIGLCIKAIKYTRRYYTYTPIVYLFILLLIYGIGQNGELTDIPAFLMLGGMIGNLINYKEVGEDFKVSYNQISSKKVVGESV